MLFGVDFYGNINHRKSYFKQIFDSHEEPEIVIEDWLRKFCNTWLREEFYLQAKAERYQRAKERIDYGNGYYRRRILTAKGRFDVFVPRGRGKKYRYTLFERYKRYSRELEDLIIDSLLLGHSTRDAKRFFDEMLGQNSISHALASKVFRVYDLEVSSWKNRKIEKEVAVLVLDAVHLKGAITGLKRAKPVLCAYCIYADGSEELIDFEPAQHESSESWHRFCGRLYMRGLTKVKFAVRDDLEQIAQAITTYWPKAIQQYCVFHLMQNFVKKLKGLKDKRMIINDTSALYEAKDKQQFYGLVNRFMAKHRQYKHHLAFKYLYGHLEDTTQFYTLPEAFQAAAKTTNRLERLFKEIKRRVKAFGRFPNTLSCKRWLYALIKEGLTPQYRRIESTQYS
jgi:transposase-like protein